MKALNLLFALITCLSFSQNKQLLYGFSDIPQSTLLNPGTPMQNDWYFGVPLLSQIHINVGSTGVNIYDLFVDDDRSFSTKLQTAINKMSPNDFFVSNQQVEIFSGGFALKNTLKKNEYISFGLYQEIDVIAYFPKDYAILAYEGNQNNINRVFDLGQLNVSGEVISTFHIGYTKQVNKALSVGLRGKIYSSIVNFRSVKNKGSFITTQGENNFLKHSFNLDLQLQTSGIASLTNEDNLDVRKVLTKRVLFGGNLGLGIDIGLSYKLTDQWTFDASLLDIGFIRHSKDVENYTLKGQITFEGVNPIFPEVDENQTAEEFLDEVTNQFEELFTIDTVNTKYTTLRPVKFNSSLNYSFGKKVEKECNCLAENPEYQNVVSLQLYAIKRPKSPQVAVTISYYRKLFESLQVKATYTADSFSFTNLGLGVATTISNVNIYILADNLLKYNNLAKAQSVSLQLGINYIIKK